MKKNTIYLPLKGRIGNQLFQYACARAIQLNMPQNTKIIIDDSEVLKLNWINSLPFYNLPNVEYVHKKFFKNSNIFSIQFIFRSLYKLLCRNKDYIKKFETEKRINSLFNSLGLLFCENGYLKHNLNFDFPIYIEGYFQSEKYFEEYSYDIKQLLDGRQFKKLKTYHDLDKIKKRNSVCVSIKVEHNIGSSMYDVCSQGYWKEAIQYILEKVEDPLFFICSDNVDYVLENLIDSSKCDYIVQDKQQPVHISLAAMSECKHFIIGNTSFGWWAQYLSRNNNKIVIAPSRWMAVDMPVDLYDKNWQLIKV